MRNPVVLILGSGPNVVAAADWPKSWFDQIVAINNAWAARPDWDALVFPEDFPEQNLPPKVESQQRLVEAEEFVPTQNQFGGFVFAGATMAFTTAYWVLAALRPRVMAFMGCDMVYPKSGNTHFYGKGAADPLRDDVSLRNLQAKSARLAVIAAAQGCACANLSADPSSLMFDRASPEQLRKMGAPFFDSPKALQKMRSREDILGYDTPDGRYDVTGKGFDLAVLDQLDKDWLDLFGDISASSNR